jgi:hypothetical protein
MSSVNLTGTFGKNIAEPARFAERKLLPAGVSNHTARPSVNQGLFQLDMDGTTAVECG